MKILEKVKYVNLIIFANIVTKKVKVVQIVWNKILLINKGNAKVKIIL